SPCPAPCSLTPAGSPGNRKKVEQAGAPRQVTRPRSGGDEEREDRAAQRPPEGGPRSGEHASHENRALLQASCCCHPAALLPSRGRVGAAALPVNAPVRGSGVTEAARARPGRPAPRP